MKIKFFLQKYKTVIENFSYLSLLQVLSLIIPLVSYPYLIKILGSELYGLVVFSRAVSAYFSIVINFGFNISATRDIAINRFDNKSISTIVSSVFLIKIALWLISFLCLLLLLFFIPALKEHMYLYLFSFGMCFNELLFPEWFFQGIEKMKYITFISLFNKLFFLCLIFIFVNNKSDYILVPVLNALGAIFSGCAAILIMKYKYKIIFSFVSLSVLKKCFYDSFPFFGSRISGIIIMQTTTLFIGNVLGYSEVAYFDLAQKISNLLKIPFSMLNQALYPLITRTKSVLIVKKIIYASSISAIAMYILLFFFVEFIVKILGGDDMTSAINVILIYSLDILFVPALYFLGNTVLVVHGFYREFNKSIIISGFLYMILLGLTYLLNIIDLYKITLLVVFITFFQTFLRFYYCKKNNLLIIK